jgi:hypothetical protein
VAHSGKRRSRYLGYRSLDINPEDVDTNFTPRESFKSEIVWIVLAGTNRVHTLRERRDNRPRRREDRSVDFLEASKQPARHSKWAMTRAFAKLHF